MPKNLGDVTPLFELPYFSNGTVQLRLFAEILPHPAGSR
jgi:hypothetical protein